MECPREQQNEVSPAAYLSWDSALPPLFFNSNILGSKPLLKGEDPMENPYSPPGPDGVPVGGKCLISEGQSSSSGAFGNFLHAEVKVMNFFLLWGSDGISNIFTSLGLYINLCLHPWSIAYWQSWRVTCSTLKSIMAEQALREEGTQPLFEMTAHVSVQDLLCFFWLVTFEIFSHVVTSLFSIYCTS